MLQFLFLMACTQPQPLKGRVVDIWNNPIEGATVLVNGGRPQTDMHGVYEISRAPGTFEFRAGKEGYIQDSSEATITEESKKAPVFKLYKKPAANGFYAVTVGDYVELKPSSVKLLGHEADALFGIVGPPADTFVEGETLSMVYKIDFSLAQVKTLGLELRKLKFVENTTMASVGGGQKTEVPVNLWVDAGKIPITISKLNSKGHFLISTGDTELKPGVYAVQAQNLLTPKDEDAWRQIPEALRTVYPVTIK